jgi:hypothetical protein
LAPELQKYYEEQFSMLSTTGWKDLIEDLTNLQKSINDLSTVADEQTLFFRKGQLDILELLFQRKAMCEKAYEDLQNETDI